MADRLWHDPEIRTFLAGRTASEIGSRITREGLPIVAILVAGATARQLGLLAALSSVAALLTGLWAGVLVDRHRRRPLMIAADIVRAALLLTIPLAAALHRLHFTQIAVVTGLVGAASLLFHVADQAWLPQFVSRSRLEEGNALVQAASAVGETGGPTLMGLLFQLIGGPLAVGVDALSYLASALSLGRLRRVEPPAAPPPAGGRAAVALEAVAGVRKVLSHPVLRPLALALATQSLFGGVHGALYELYALATLHLSPLALGVLITSGGVGALLGSVVAARVANRLGTARALIITGIVSGALAWCIPLAGGPWPLAFGALFVAQFAGDGIGTIFDIQEAVVRQSVTPDGWLGRVTASGRWMGGTLSALGALGAGALGATIGIRPAFCIAAGGLLLAPAWLVFSALRTLPSNQPAAERKDAGLAAETSPAPTF